MKTLNLLFTCFCILATSFHVSGQEIWQSDLRVTMKQSKSENNLIYEVKVTTDNDDASRSPHLIFTLPRNSKVNKVTFDGRLGDTAYSIYGSASQATQSNTKRIDGYIKVDFPNLNRLTTSVTISIQPVGNGWKEGDGASAYIYSTTPEANKENNFLYLPLHH